MTNHVAITRPGPRISEHHLSTAEQVLVPNRSNLPKAYRDFLLQHNGGTPDRRYFTFAHPNLGHPELCVDEFLRLEPNPIFGHDGAGLIHVTLAFRQLHDSAFLPIGFADRDNLLLIGINDWEDTYAQVWLKYMEETGMTVATDEDPSEAMYFVSDGFESFLEALTGDSEMDRAQ